MIPISTVIHIHHNFQHLPESLNVHHDKTLKLVNLYVLCRMAITVDVGIMAKPLAIFPGDFL